MDPAKRVTEFRYLAPLVGDIPLISRVFSGQTINAILRLVMRRDVSVLLLFVVKTVVFFLGALAVIPRVFLRYRHGAMTIGWIITSIAALLIAFCNWPGCTHDAWAPIYILALPVNEVIESAPSWVPEVFLEYQSIQLYYGGIAFCALAALHILISYLPLGTQADRVKRGRSIFWFVLSWLFFRLRKQEKAGIWWMVETGLVIGLSYALPFFGGEAQLCSFLFTAGIAHGLIEAYEYFGLKSYVD